MEVKLGICNFCVPGTGVFAPEIVKEMGLDGMSIEFGSYEHGWPLSQRKLQDYYLKKQQELGIEYPNVGVSDGDNIPFHARPGTRWDPVVNAEGTKAIDATSYIRFRSSFLNFNASLMKNDEDIEYGEALSVLLRLCGEKGISIGCENPNSIEDQKSLSSLLTGRTSTSSLTAAITHACQNMMSIKFSARCIPVIIPRCIKDGVMRPTPSMSSGPATGFRRPLISSKRKTIKGGSSSRTSELDPMRGSARLLEIMRQDIAVLGRQFSRQT